MKILFVDDDEGVRTLMEAVFRRHALTVEHACDGCEALSRIRRETFDAMVLDLMMPKVNGFEVLREIKQCAPQLLPRTVVLTAAADATHRDFADGRLVRRVMRKPFDLDDFVQEVLSCATASQALRSKAV